MMRHLDRILTAKSAMKQQQDVGSGKARIESMPLKTVAGTKSELSLRMTDAGLG